MKPLTNKPNGQGGFTLLEMMMVVAILGILAAIALLSFQRYVERANLANAHAELVNIHHAIKRFRVANPGGRGTEGGNAVDTTRNAGLSAYVAGLGVEATVDSKYQISADMPNNDSLRYNLMALPRPDSGYTKAVWMSSAGQAYRCDNAAAAKSYATDGDCEEIK